MFDQGTLDSAWNSAGTTNATKAAPSKTKGISGFLLNNASTIGGILGGIGGEVIDPFGGGIAGASLGSAIGQKIKNSQTGSTDSTLKAGIEGGAGQLLGLGAGKIGSKLLSKVITKPIQGAADKVATNDAAQQALSDVQPFRGVQPKALAENDLGGSLERLKGLGMAPTPANMRAAANVATGDNGVVSGTMRSILANSPKVDVGNVLDDAEKALTKEGGQLGQLSTKGKTPANNVLASLRNEFQSNLFGNNGSLTGKTDANSVFDTIQNLEGRIRSLGNEGVDGAEKRVLQTTKQSLESKLYNDAGVNEAVKNYKLQPEDVDAIHASVENAGGSKSLASDIVNGVNNASSAKDLRAYQRPFVQMSNLADEADKLASGKGTITAAQDAAKEAAGKTGGNSIVRDIYYTSQNPAMAPFLLGDAVKSGRVANVVSKASPVVEKAQNINNSVPGNQTVGSILSKVVGQNATHPSTSQTTEQNPDTSVPDTPSSVPTQDQSAQEPTFGKDELVTAIAADPENASTYMSLYKLFQSDTNSTTQKNVAAAKNAQSALSNLESTFQSAGGGQGKIGGTIANIEGKLGINSSVATYNSIGTSLAASIYKALGNTGTISDADQKLINQLIPRTTDTAETAQQKVSTLSNMLNEAEVNASGQ